MDDCTCDGIRTGSEKMDFPGEEPLELVGWLYLGFFAAGPPLVAGGPVVPLTLSPRPDTGQTTGRLESSTDYLANKSKSKHDSAK